MEKVHSGSLYQDIYSMLGRNAFLLPELSKVWFEREVLTLPLGKVPGRRNFN